MKAQARKRKIRKREITPCSGADANITILETYQKILNNWMSPCMMAMAQRDAIDQQKELLGAEGL